MSNFNKKYKQKGVKGLFDEQEANEKLSKIGNQLEKISFVIDFEFFRFSLESKLLNPYPELRLIRKIMLELSLTMTL
jgi:hypothetical protein